MKKTALVTHEDCLQHVTPPGHPEQVARLEYILEALKDYEGRIKVTLVPNITNICYGRGVGYKIEEIVLDEKTQQISETKIRAQMRKEGKLK